MKKLLIPVLLLTGSLAIAQDPIFSQFYATPLQINPGFTGSTGSSRIGTSYRNQWSGFNNAYRTYTVACDQHIEKLNSGVGLLAETDDAGNGIYKTFRMSALYAYRLKITDDLSVRLGVEAGLRQSGIDWQKLTFLDQIDPVNGFTLNTEEIQPDVTTRTTADISTGMLLSNSRFYVGLALHHLTSPGENLLRFNENLLEGVPIRYTLHGGTDFVVKAGNKNRPPSFISPNFLFVTQGPHRQINVGAYASAGSVFGGVWFRHTITNRDAVILLAGFRQGIFKVGVSYDMTVSGLAGYAGGTYELSLGMVFEKEKRPDINDCTRMFQ